VILSPERANLKIMDDIQNCAIRSKHRPFKRFNDKKDVDMRGWFDLPNENKF